MPPLAVSLTTPDVITLVVCAVLGVRGALKGFVWQLVRTVGLVGALWGATRFYEPVGAWIDERFPVPTFLTPLLGWLLILAGTFLLFSFLAHVARGLVRTADMSTFDRFLGFALGTVMGIGLVAVGFVVWGHNAGEDELRETLRGSYAARGMAVTVEFVEPLFPDEVRQRFRKSLDAISASG
jgi:uncharacterized membrane protein required for colicin V production